MDGANDILGVLNFLLLSLSLNPISSFMKIKSEGVKDIENYILHSKSATNQF